MKRYLSKGTYPIDIAIALVAIASWLTVIFPVYTPWITLAAGIFTGAGCVIRLYLNVDVNKAALASEVTAPQPPKEIAVLLSDKLLSSHNIIETNNDKYWEILTSINNKYSKLANINFPVVKDRHAGSLDKLNNLISEMEPSFGRIIYEPKKQRDYLIHVDEDIKKRYSYELLDYTDNRLMSN